MNTNRDSSLRTKLYSAKTVSMYHNSFRNAIDAGITQTPGGVANKDASLEIKIHEGDNTIFGNVNVLTSRYDYGYPMNTTTTTTTPTSPPTSSDRIINSLTTSLASYIAASAGSWVSITSAEYASLQTNVVSTAIAGTSTAFLNAATSIALLSDHQFIVNNPFPVDQPSIPANSYIYAFAVQYSKIAANSNMQIYTNTSTTSYGGYNPLGNTLPATYSDGTINTSINYYVLRSPSSTNGSTDGTLGIYTGTPLVNSTGSAVYIGGIVSGRGAHGKHYQTNPPIPTDVLGIYDTDQCMGFQALTTPTKQWD